MASSDIIIGARLEILHLAFQIAARREDKRRHAVAKFARLLEQACAGAVGQLQVQDHKVVMIGFDIFQTVRSSQHAIHRIAFGLQAALKNIDQLFLIFNNQDAHLFRAFRPGVTNHFKRHFAP
jgi:hypothetical protein